MEFWVLILWLTGGGGGGNNRITEKCVGEFWIMYSLFMCVHDDYLLLWIS